MRKDYLARYDWGGVKSCGVEKQVLFPIHKDMMTMMMVMILMIVIMMVETFVTFCCYITHCIYSYRLQKIFRNL